MTGDRVWRMPLFQHYTRQVTDSQLADLNNIGKYSRYVSHDLHLINSDASQRRSLLVVVSHCVSLVCVSISLLVLEERAQRLHS